jgi:regulation of enolase protein 1 (concanavalin A-like superfamily)
MCKKLFYLSCFIVFLLGLALTSTAKAQVQDPSLVGWWKLDETSGITAADSSGSGNDGVTYGGPQWVTGKFGGALDLDGEDDYVDLPIGSLISSLTNSTLSIWTNWTGAGGDWQRIWDFGSSTDINMFLSPSVGGTNVLRFAITTGSWGAEDQTSAQMALPSGWHNVTVVINAVNNTHTLYLDSEVVTELTNTRYVPSTLGQTTQNWLGRSQYPDPYFAGSLDDFRIYNKAFTVDEVDLLVPRFIVKRPQPADGGTVTSTTVTLSWLAGHTADSHHVYIGESLDNVINGTGGTNQGLTKDASFVVTNLETGKTYYWRVDEIEADGVTVHVGPVWSFTVSPKMASNPTPPNGTRFVIPSSTLTWTSGAGATTHHIYLSDNLADVQAGTGDADKGTVDVAEFVPGTLAHAKTYYWRVDELDGTDTYPGEIWSFRTVPGIQIKDAHLVGWWKLDEGAGTTALDWSGHEYHGTLVNGPIWIEGIDAGALNFDGQDDYVDLSIGTLLSTLTNSTFAIWANFQNQNGNWPRIWDFGKGAATANMFLTPAMGAVGAMRFAITTGGNVAGAEDQTTATNTLPAGWHHVTVVFDPGTTTHILYLDGQVAATNNTGRYTPSSLGVTTQNWLGRSQYPADTYYPGDLDDFRIYNYTMTQNEILEVMKGDPLPARKPHPANKSLTDVEKALPLSWTPGENAAQHDVYLGTNALVVEGTDTSDTTGIYRGRQDPNSYSPPAGLEPGTTYYWRVDEINTDGTISIGRIWSFTVASYLIVDDFEDYDDINNLIYYIWADYYVNNTGMTVGHLPPIAPPYAEQTVIHGGVQSMYMHYDNDGTINEGTNFERGGTLLYSEAERVWPNPQDWTRGGANALTLWFRGLPGSLGSFTPGPPITMTAVGADIGGNADQFHYAYKRLSGTGSITVKVLSVSNTNPLAKAGVMIRQTLEAGSVQAAVIMSPGNRATFIRRTTIDGAALSTSRVVNLPQWVRLTRSGNSFTAQYSANGTSWTTIGTPMSITMFSDVYVGLCLTSRNADATCIAEFSDLNMTGTVTGDWKSQDIGLENNSPEQLYIALQDSANNSTVVKHPNPASTTIDTWTQWNIPLSAFGGVNLQSIGKLSIGVGDRSNPQPGGAGNLYVDDIGLSIP